MEGTIDHLTARMREFIGRQEMMWVATIGRQDESACDFRGGPAGFIRVASDRRVFYPEFRENAESVGNIIDGSRVGLLFLDFFDTTLGLRVNGRARVLDHAALLADEGIADDEWAAVSSGDGATARRWVVVDITEAFVYDAGVIPRLTTVEKEISWRVARPTRKGFDYFGTEAGGASRRTDAAPVRATALFRGCSDEEIRAVAEIAREVSFGKGEPLIRQGEAVTRFLVLLDGRASVRKGQRDIGEMKSGDFVGEIGLLSRSPATATVSALEPTRALAVETVAFRKLLRSTPSLAALVTSALAARTAQDQMAGADVSRGLVLRLGLPGLIEHFPPRAVWASFMFVNGFVTIALLIALAMLTKSPFIFPPLGSSAFLFFLSPLAPAATPRNAILGHAIGLISGYSALLAFGLQNAPPNLQAGIIPSRILAAAFSLALAGAVMVLMQSPHPPAAATALIVSLGLITRPSQLVVLEAAVIILVLQAIAINRFARLDYPFWSRRRAAAKR